MGKKAKSQEKVGTAPGAVNPHDEWQKAIQASTVSEQTEFCDYKPAVYMLKTKDSTKELYQQISVNCTRANTFTVISYDTLIDKAIQLGDPKKRPKEFSATTSLGLDACEMLLKFKTERDQIIESNESKDHDGKLPVPEIPSQLIALMLKFTILCAKEERIEKCRPRLDSGATEKAGKGKDKPKSPKKGGKSKDDSATGEAINKDWSNLKKRGQEDDANNYLNDEPKSGPTQYIIVIDLPGSSFQDVVYHSAVHLQIPVYGILLHKNQQYNSSHHGQWPTKFTKIPCEENVKNIDFDSIAKACYDVVLSENVKFEIFKTYLKIVEVPKLEKLSECQNETVKNCLETIVGKLCSLFSLNDATIHENTVNTSNSPDSVPNNSSLDALLQFGSDSSSAPTPTPGNAQGGVIPEILGAETSIFDSTTNSAQNCAQKALYHELLENYRESTGDRNVSMPVVDLALKSLAAQSDIDQVFEKGTSKTLNLNGLVNFDCVEHLSKEALRARLVQLDRQFSSITVRKFNGDASRLIIASNKDKHWEALLLGAMTHQQFFKFVSPGLGKWFKLHEELFKSNSEMKIRQEALSRKVSAQSVASNQELGLNQEFVQKDSLKGEDLQTNSDTKPKTPDSKPGSAKGKKPNSRASSKMKLQEKSAKNSRPVSAAVVQEEPPKLEYSDPPIRMPEFLGTGLEFEKRAGMTVISSGESGFNYSQSLIGVNEHQGEFSTQIVSNGKMTISTHGFNRDSQEINSFVVKLAHGTCVAYKRGTVKEYLEMTKGVQKTEDFSKIPMGAVEIAETPRKVSKTAEKTVELPDTTEETENEEEEPCPSIDEISFGLPNGMIGEFLTTNSGLSVRFSWTNSVKVTDKVCESVHPSNEIKSRLVTSEGVIVDTLWNGEENIIQNGKGERWHANKVESDDNSTELTNLVEPELLRYEANDPSTDEKYVQRDDGVKLVSRPDGSVICHHKDGTRITKFDTLTRVEHPAYGSILFANGGIAITLVTGARIMSNEKGDAYQINDPVTSDFIRLENGQWTLNDCEPIFKESTENDVYICVKDDGSALEFTDGSSVYEYARKKKCGMKEHNFGGIEGCGDLRAITLLDKVEEADVNQGVWKSGYDYQEDTIIPAGLRISQIGGGTHALVQDDPVLQLQNRFKIPKKFIARRFTNYKKLDLEKFKHSIKKLEESNLPKQIIYTDRTATIEQTELISTVLGGEGERGLNSPDVIPQQISITPNEAENLYQEAQRPISSKSSASSFKPTESVQKRLLDYQAEIQKFRCDIVALQNKNVPKYFDSELGKSWLETKDVLEELAKEVPSN